MFVPDRDVLLHPLARDPARVGLGEHEVVVDAEDEALARARARDSARESRARAARRAGGRERDRAVGREQAEDRVDRQHPAREEARLVAEVEEQQDRRGREQERRAGGGARSAPTGAAEREQRRQPAEAPGERAEVVAPAAACWRGRACRPPRPAVSVCFSSRLAERVVVEQRVRVGGHEARDTSARARARGCARARARPARRTPPRPASRARSRPCTWSRSPRRAPSPASTYSRVRPVR